jgi:hypothetical protein
MTAEYDPSMPDSTRRALDDLQRQLNDALKRITLLENQINPMSGIYGAGGIPIGGGAAGAPYVLHGTKR